MQRLPSYAVFFVCSREGSLHERPVSGYQKAGLTTGTIRPARAQRVFGASPVVRAWPGEEAWPGDKVAVTVRYDMTDNNPLLTGLELGKGTLLTEIHAYPGHRGSVRMAVGDVTGNGRADIVTVPSRGVAEVRVFFPFDDEMRGGVDVAVGRVRPGYFLG